MQLRTGHGRESLEQSLISINSTADLSRCESPRALPYGALRATLLGQVQVHAGHL